MQKELEEEEKDMPLNEEDDIPEDVVIDCKSLTEIAAQIIDEMALWIDEDIESNKNNSPALKKLLFSPKLLKSLKNLKVQQFFLEMGGCKYLADWLSKLPDGSFPWINIIEIGLEIADFLPIEKQHLIESGLGKALEKIRKSKTISQSLRTHCQEVINKWKRQILMLDGGYDEEGRHEEQYREFKIRKQKEEEYYSRTYKRQKTGEDPSGNDRRLVKQESNGNEGEGDDPTLKKQKSDGMFIPQKNMFDFTYRPMPTAEIKDKKVKAESVKGKFIKTMLQMKKVYTSQQKATFAAIKPNLNPDKN